VPVFETNKQVYVAAASKPEVPVFETDKLAPGYIRLAALSLSSSECVGYHVATGVQWVTRLAYSMLGRSADKCVMNEQLYRFFE
jgi:hypothetical protein